MDVSTSFLLKIIGANRETERQMDTILVLHNCFVQCSYEKNSCALRIVKKVKKYYACNMCLFSNEINAVWIEGKIECVMIEHKKS